MVKLRFKSDISAVVNETPLSVLLKRNKGNTDLIYLYQEKYGIIYIYISNKQWGKTDETTEL